MCGLMDDEQNYEQYYQQQHKLGGKWTNQEGTKDRSRSSNKIS